MEKRKFKWNLDRPLAVFDIESTGATPRADRIIDIAIVKLMPDGTRETHKIRVNPGIPIPRETTKVHGITDADVAGCPTFREVAQRLLEILEDCDLAGYNLARFDVPMLVEEFQRVGIRFETSDRRIVDAQRIYHKHEPRDLPAAVAFFCGEMHLGAHDAQADAEATLSVLEAELQKYADLPRDIEGLDQYCNPRDPEWVDREGKLKWSNGDVVLNFTKNKNKRLRDIMRDDPKFVKWMLNSDLPRDMREIVQNALDGKWPAPPAVGPVPAE